MKLTLPAPCGDVGELLAARFDRAGRGQSGVTLLEVLIGMAIAVPLTLSSVLGMLVTIRTSSAVERHQRLKLALASATEDVKAIPYVECGTTADYDALIEEWNNPTEQTLVAARSATSTAAARAATVAADAAIPLPTGTVTGVTYWDPSTDGFTTTCSDDAGAQQLTVKVAENTTVLSATIVIRDPAAAPAKVTRS